jgi:hypothetical protein
MCYFNFKACTLCDGVRVEEKKIDLMIEMNRGKVFDD